MIRLHLILLFSLLSLPLFAQGNPNSGDRVQLGAENLRGPVTMVERSDWARYDNGTYVGHVYREVRSQLRRLPDSTYQGTFYVLEETLRDLRNVERPVDRIVNAEYTLQGDGTPRISPDQGFPALRGFPVFPQEPVAPHDRWTAEGSRAVDPFNEGHPTILPLVAQYEYRGLEDYQGQRVHHIFAKYATRFRSPGSLSTTTRSSALPQIGTLVEAVGTHEVDILLRLSDGLPLLSRDRLDETFTQAGGVQRRYKGFTLTFGGDAVPLNRAALVADIRGILDKDGRSQKSPAGPDTGSAPAEPVTGSTALGGTPSPPVEGTRSPGPEGVATLKDLPKSGIDVSEVNEGVRLTVPDLRFVSDSDEVLPQERDRLDLIAQVLRGVAGKTFLVEGHTASVGKVQGEMELSQRRAKKIVDELVRRGIGTERFLYKGWGGTRPVADNQTEEGRAKNRRVEITILE